MSDKVANKTEYLKELYQLIYDEIDIAILSSNDDEYVNSWVRFRDDFIDKKPLNEVIDLMWEQFKSSELRIFRREYEDEVDAGQFTYVIEAIKIKALCELVDMLSDKITSINETTTYEKMKLIFKDKDITLLAVAIDNLKENAKFNLDTINEEYDLIPKELKKYANEAIELNKKLLDSKSRVEQVELAYQMKEQAEDAVEQLITAGTKYDWTSDLEIAGANWMFVFLIHMNATWANLMLLREGQILKLGIEDNPNVYKSFEIYEYTKEALNQYKAMVAADNVYNNTSDKNTKK